MGGHRRGQMRPKAGNTSGPCPSRPLSSPCGSHVLLLVWEELWSLVRIIPAEFSLVATGTPAATGEPCRRTRLDVLHGFLLHSRVKEARA